MVKGELLWLNPKTEVQWGGGRQHWMDWCTSKTNANCQEPQYDSGCLVSEGLDHKCLLDGISTSLPGSLPDAPH